MISYKINNGIAILTRNQKSQAMQIHNPGEISKYFIQNRFVM